MQAEKASDETILHYFVSSKLQDGSLSFSMKMGAGQKRGF
jgi:hypothetical protein